MDSDQNQPPRKTPMTDAERKHKQRLKDKAMKEGTYQASLFDIAKQELSAMEMPDFKTILEKPAFFNQLSPAEINKLQAHQTYLRAKIKKEKEEVENKSRESHDINEKAQRFGNEEISELRNSIILPQSVTEKAQLIEQKINENLFVFLEYMDGIQTTPADFLKIIVDLLPKHHDDISTKLFVRVCALYKGEQLRITKDFIQKGIQFLVEKKKDQRASIGLLRLAFQNDISFSYLPVELLLRFQHEYEHLILQFFKTFSNVKNSVVESLPESAFFFTSPLIQSIKTGGHVLHTQIPYQFLPFIIRIVCFAFDDDQDSFDDFLNMFKEGCIQFYYELQDTEFHFLLSNLLEETKSMNKKFFRQLSKITQVFQKSFRLINDKKIAKFDSRTVQLLVEGGEDEFNMMKQAPSILGNSTSAATHKCISQIIKRNPQLECFQTTIEIPLQPDNLKYFNALGIHSPLTMQEVAFRLCVECINKGQWFFQYETGQGKTALCFAIASAKASLGNVCFIINQSEDLTFRDFKKASGAAPVLGQNVYLLTADDDLDLRSQKIIFASFDQFATAVSNGYVIIEGNFLIIFDEFDSILLDKDNLSASKLDILRQIPTLISFTGSELLPIHIELLRNLFGGQIINMNIQAFDEQKQVLTGAQVFHTLPDFKREISNIIDAKSHSVPIIIIAGDHSSRVEQQLIQAKLPVQNLCGKTSIEVESTMSIFTEKSGSRYQTFIISVDQGRGLDFPTDQDIENFGGVFLMIATLPSYYLQYRQFIGRTGRIGNKGQFCVVLHDKDAKNQDGKIYLHKNLQMLMNQDIQEFSKFRHQQMSKRQKNNNEESKSAGSQKTISDQQYLVDEEDTFDDKQNISDNISILGKRNFHQKLRSEQTDQSLINQKEDSELIIQSMTGDIHEDEFVLHKTANLGPQMKTRTHNNSLKQQIDSQYFEGYSKIEIHRDMTSDSQRMRLFRDAIEVSCKDKVVIDVGAGTGVLSIMAAKAGASTVHAIENSSIIKEAKKQISSNNCEAAIKTYHGLAEEFCSSEIKADVIVSEWMGYALLYENMLPSVLKVRDSCLKEGGTMIPQQSVLLMAGFRKEGMMQDIDMSTINKASTTTVIIERCAPEWIVTSQVQLLSLNLQEDSFMQNKFDSKFEIHASADALVQGLVIWFDAYLQPGIVLSTSPQAPQTHWMQSLLHLKDEVLVVKGEALSGTLKVSPQKVNYRALRVNLSIDATENRPGFKQVFDLD